MKIGGLLYIIFIMAEVGNLDIYFGVNLVYFHNDKGG